jgi:hypothetical protein
MPSTLGKALIVLGLASTLVGTLILLLGRFVKIGHLPLDLKIERDGYSLYMPFGSALLLSLLATLALNLILRLKR